MDEFLINFYVTRRRTQVRGGLTISRLELEREADHMESAYGWRRAFIVRGRMKTEVGKYERI